MLEAWSKIMARKHIVLKVNSEVREIEAEPGVTLVDVLRGPLGLTGTKEACGQGECGACTVLIDGTPMLACLLLAQRVKGDVVTIEGLAPEIADLRAAFADTGGFQCGFCTSGQIVRAAALLRDGLPNDKGEAERFVRYQMSGNICRCTGYNGIVDAVLRTAAGRGEAQPKRSASS
jgi:aerobic-type carbon monoxide dehydrogenase small subunit (CoxS/CutS family)